MSMKYELMIPFIRIVKVKILFLCSVTQNILSCFINSIISIPKSILSPCSLSTISILSQRSLVNH